MLGAEAVTRDARHSEAEIKAAMMVHSTELKRLGKLEAFCQLKYILEIRTRT